MSMGKDLIGKRVRLQIGGELPEDDEKAVIGEDVRVHVPSEDLDKYDSIIGEKVELVIASDIDALVRNVIHAMENSQEHRRAEVLAVCKEVLAETDANAKASKVANLVAIGSGIATIAQFIIQLKSMVGL